MDSQTYERSTEQEMADEEAFRRLVVDSMVWSPKATDSFRLTVIGNARRAWHQALKWERTR